MISEKREKKILWISFFSGLAFAVVELIYAIYSHSQSVLMDAVYDATELIFIGLILFLTPLFYKPVSEEHPYGYFQIESIFLIVKGFMMLSVTMGVGVEIIQSALDGGNPVDGVGISVFQIILGVVSLVIYLWMKHINRSMDSPTVQAELLGWKLDIFYSLGMSAAFFASAFLSKTPLAFLLPYFDPIIAVAIIVFMLPENVKMLWGAIRNVFLFPPDDETVERIREICTDVMEDSGYMPVFFDVTKTGRHLWVAVYFQVSEKLVDVQQFRTVTAEVNLAVAKEFPESTCELLLTTSERKRPGSGKSALLQQSLRKS